MVWFPEGEIAASVADAPAWYWWHFVGTKAGPLLRLYIEIDYQPLRCYALGLFFDVAQAEADRWLTRLMDQRSLGIVIRGPSGACLAVRRLAFGESQSVRLRRLLQRLRSEQDSASR